MSNIEILSLVVTIVCLVSFCLVFTFLFRHYYLSSIEDIKIGKEDRDILELAREDAKRNKNKNKALTITGKILSYALLAVVVAGFGVSLYSRFANNNLVFGDSGVIVISSGSMSKRNVVNTYLDEFHLDNQFDTYDVIGVTKYNSQSELKLYDVVAFKGEDKNIYVHRIIEIRSDNTYITRGDSNNLSDTNNLYKGYLTFDKIIGYYNGTRIKTLGIFVVFLQSNSGIITIVSIVYCLLMFDHYRTKYDETLEERTNLLLELTKFDLNSTEEIKSLVNVSKDSAIRYAGNDYIFSNGKYIKTLKSEENVEFYEVIDDSPSETEDKKETKKGFSRFLESIKNKDKKDDSKES